MKEPVSEQVVDIPNPYPIVADIEFPEVWDLCKQARELAWDPVADIAPDARAAGAEFWSLRAWMEHGAVPYGCLRLREAVFGHLPFEIKQHITNFISFVCWSVSNFR